MGRGKKDRTVPGHGYGAWPDNDNADIESMTPKAFFEAFESNSEMLPRFWI
jgi:hypothetical protein